MVKLLNHPSRQFNTPGGLYITCPSDLLLSTTDKNRLLRSDRDVVIVRKEICHDTVGIHR